MNLAEIRKKDQELEMQLKAHEARREERKLKRLLASAKKNKLIQPSADVDSVEQECESNKSQDDQPILNLGGIVRGGERGMEG